MKITELLSLLKKLPMPYLPVVDKCELAGGGDFRIFIGYSQNGGFLESAVDLDNDEYDRVAVLSYGWELKSVIHFIHILEEFLKHHGDLAIYLEDTREEIDYRIRPALRGVVRYGGEYDTRPPSHYELIEEYEYD